MDGAAVGGEGIILADSSGPHPDVMRESGVQYYPMGSLPMEGTDATIALEDVDWSIALSELYERVDFTAAPQP